jgi:hypothetical protein
MIEERRNHVLNDNLRQERHIFIAMIEREKRDVIDEKEKILTRQHKHRTYEKKGTTDMYIYMFLCFLRFVSSDHCSL